MRRQRDDRLAMGIGERTGADEQGARPAFHEGCEGRCYLADAGRSRNDDLLSRRLRPFLNIGLLGDGFQQLGTDKHGNCPRARDELAQ